MQRTMLAPAAEPLAAAAALGPVASSASAGACARAGPAPAGQGHGSPPTAARAYARSPGDATAEAHACNFASVNADGSIQAGPDVTLWGAWFCPYAQRAWIALEEAGAPYRYVEVNPYTESSGPNNKVPLPIEEKRRRYPGFVETSPKGLVPGLDDNRRRPPFCTRARVSDSMVVVEYISDAFCGDALCSFSKDSLRFASPAEAADAAAVTPRQLMPFDPTSRARVRSACRFADERIIPFYYKALMLPPGPDRDAAQASFLEGLQEFGAAMVPLPDSSGSGENGGGGGNGGCEGGNAYFLGATFSVADIAVVPWLVRALSVLKAHRGLALPGFGDLTAPPLGDHGDDRQIERRDLAVNGEATAISQGAAAVHPAFLRLRAWYNCVVSRPSVKATLADPKRLVDSYAGYANGSATSAVAKQFVKTGEAK